MDLRADYDEFVTSCTDVESFTYCRSSHLNGRVDVVFEHNIECLPHPMVELCVRNHLSYLTCITFREGTYEHVGTKPSRRKRGHVCSVFPVMLGSRLDAQLCEYKRQSKNKTGSDDYEMEHTRGMFIMDGSLTVIPFLLTNRKEMGHRTIGAAPYVFCLFMYDRLGRGYRISMNSQQEIVFRDCNGKEVGPFVDTSDSFIVHMKHLNFERTHLGFNGLYDYPINIDSLENKLILSPVNILHMLINMARRKPDKARDYISRGFIEKFASSNINYKESKHVKVFGDSSGSFNFRRIQPNQVLRDGIDWTIIRPIPSNVAPSIIKNTEYFCCLVEKNVSIDSFNRTMMLLKSTRVCNEMYMQRYSINRLLDTLLEMSITNTNRESGRIVLVNGGLPTHYNSQADFATFFTTCKRINPLVEVVAGATFYMLNLTAGLPFTSLPDGTWVSPLELNKYFRQHKENSTANLFGTNCPPLCVELSGYAVLTKLMTGINFHKNRFGGIDGKKYFECTSENICSYVADNKRFDAGAEEISFKTLFSSHPQTTADGYILSSAAKFESDVMQRSRFEMEIVGSCTMEFLRVSSTDCMCEYDALGNVIRKYLCVARFDKLGDPLNLRIFSQTKFLLNTRKTRAGYVYLLFKLIDERVLLENEFDISIVAIRAMEKKKRRLYYDFITCARTDFFDGTKLSDPSSQKGLAVVQDMSRYQSKLGYVPEVVGSVFSLVGRMPMMQLKAMAKQRCTEGRNKKIFYGRHRFDILKNLSSSMKSNSPIKIDVYSLKIFATNNLPICSYNLTRRSQSRRSRNNVLGHDSVQRAALATINALKIGFELSDRHGNTLVEHVVNEFDSKPCAPKQTTWSEVHRADGAPIET